jgi:hypothetical protein
MKRENKNQIISSRITKTQYVQILKLSNKYNVSMSKVLHIIIGEYLEKEKR